MERQHMTQSSFAQVLGISSASLSNIFTGRSKPTLNHVAAIRSKFPTINLDWLLYGNLPMFIDEKNAASPATDGAANGSKEQALDFGASQASSPTSPQQRTTTPVSPLNIIDHRPQNPLFQNSFHANPPQEQKVVTKYIDKPQRHITEIRVFYDDNTWESFVPKK